VDISDSWVYEQLRRRRIDKPRSEVDLADLYEVAPGQRAVASPVPRRRPAPRHMASARRFLPHADADALSYAQNLFVGILDRIYPPHSHQGGASWPLPLSVFDWPYYEWLLHAETDYPDYKDHIVHSLRVAALGRWLIEECNSSSTAVPSQQGELAKAASRPAHVQRLLAALNLNQAALADRVILAAWWLAALFHDIGYEVYLVGQLEKKLADSLPWYGGDVAAGLVRGCRSETLQRSLFRCYLECGDVTAPDWLGRRKPWEAGLYRECLGNHSVAGALMLLMSLDEARSISGCIRAELELIFHLAAEAVFYHDLLPLKKPEDNARAKCAIRWKHTGTTEIAAYTAHCPLGALLALSDHLQDWGRLKLEPQPTDDGCKALKACERRECIRLEVTSGPPPRLEVDPETYGSDSNGVTLGYLIESGLLDFADALSVVRQ